MTSVPDLLRFERGQFGKVRLLWFEKACLASCYIILVEFEDRLNRWGRIGWLQVPNELNLEKTLHHNRLQLPRDKLYTM